MAIIIKSKVYPKKWLLRKKLLPLPKNHRLTQKFLDKRNHQLASIDKRCAHAREMVKNYLGNIDPDKKIAIARSERKYRAKLVAEVITFALTSKMALDRESEALASIAQKIVSNICCTTQITLTNNSGIKTSLAQLISADVYLPSNHVATLQMKYKEILLHDHQQDSGGWVAMIMKKESFCVHFHEDDAENIFNSVAEQVLSCCPTPTM